MIRFDTVAVRRELVGFAGIVERNTYLIRRFAWWEVAWFLYTVANTLTIVFIAKGAESAGYRVDVNRMTIVLCTHDMAEAEALADRVGILDAGELLFLEPVDDIRRRFGVETLEQAFFAATGKTIEDEQ